MNQDRLKIYIRNQINERHLELLYWLNKAFATGNPDSIDEPLKAFLKEIKSFMIDLNIDQVTIDKDYMPMFNAIQRQLRGTLEDKEEAHFKRHLEKLRQESIYIIWRIKSLI